jgi:hypothetical protein
MGNKTAWSDWLEIDTQTFEYLGIDFSSNGEMGSHYQNCALRLHDGSCRTVFK